MFTIKFFNLLLKLVNALPANSARLCHSSRNKLIAASVFILGSSLGSLYAAPMSGTYTVPGSFATIAAAVTSLNTNGVSAAVIINITGGYTENAPAGGYLLGSAVLNASTSAVKTVTFQKISGVNPLITAPTGTGTTDALFSILGTDYVTINSIDLKEKAANGNATKQMEYGYALYNLNATAPFDGCQNDIIENCTVTLTNVNTNGSYGIYSSHTVHNSTTALTLTASGDLHSNNKFYGNTLTNCFSGITLNGFNDVSPYAFYDQGNDVGGSSTTTGNTVSDLATNGASNVYAVYLLNQNAVNASYNTLNNTLGGGSSNTTGLIGIYISATNATATTNGNNITLSNTASALGFLANAGIYSDATGTNLTANSNTITVTELGTKSLSPYGIYFNSTGNFTCTGNTITVSQGVNAATYGIYAGLGGSAVGTINVSTNNIAISSTGTTTTAVRFIFATGVSASETINGNTFSAASLTSTTGNVYLIEASNSSTNPIITNNVTSGTLSLNVTGAGGTFYGYNNTGNPASGTATVTGNNFSNVVLNAGTGAAAFVGINSIPSNNQVQTISNNTISNITGGNQTVTGIQMGQGASGCALSGNTISTLSGSAANYGIYISNVGPVTLAISGNNVNTIGSTGAVPVYGIYDAVGKTTNIYQNKVYNIANSNAAGQAYGITVAAGTTTNIYNNMVGQITASASTANPAVVGLNITGGATVNAYFNSVFLSGTSSGTGFGSAGLYASTAPTLTLNNNLITNRTTPTGVGLAVAYWRSDNTISTYASTSNNNMFHAGNSSPSHLIYYDGTNSKQTLNNYQNFIGPTIDAASVTENNTPFTSTAGASAGFLQINGVVSVCYNAGVNITGITTDYYAITRAGNAGYGGSAVFPTIGGSEYIVPPSTYDAGASGITLPASLCPGSQNIKVVVTNYGNTILTSVTVTLTINGVAQAPQTFSGLHVNQFAHTTVNLGSFNFPNSSTANTVLATTSLPNGQPDGQTTNDSYTNSSIYTSLNGTYTVGVGQNFATLTAAVTYANTYGLCGATVFNLTDAAYDVNETFPVVLNPVTNSANTLTIKPASGITATITSTSTTGLLQLNGAGYVTINGGSGANRNIVLINSGLGVYTVDFNGACVSDQITNCTIENNNGTDVLVDGIGTASVTIQKNNIADAATGYTTNGVYVNNAGATVTVNSNKISNCTNNGVTLLAAASACSISSNIINYATTATTPQMAISVTSGSGHTITGNTIGGNGSGNFWVNNANVTSYGIYYDVTGGTTSTITGNSIQKFKFTIVSNAPLFAGIYVQNGNVNIGAAGAGNGNSVQNIIVGGSGGAGAANTLYGIWTAGTGNVNVNYDTITNLSTNGTIGFGGTTFSSCFGIYYTAKSTNPSLSNNVINNLSSTTFQYLDITSGAAANANSGAAVCGLYYGVNSSGATIANNTINSLYGTSASATRNPVVIGIGTDINNSGGNIYDNLVYDLTNNATNTSPYAGIGGIRVFRGNWNVYNNQVIITNSTNTNNVVIDGISDCSTNSNSYFYNSVYIGGGANTGAATSAAWNMSQAANAITLRNNLLYNVRTNTGAANGNNYALSITVAVPPSTFNSDYNNLRSAGNAANYIGLNGNAGTPQSTMAGWQSQYSGDLNSQNGKVLFNQSNPPVSDLTPASTTNCWLFGKGTPITTPTYAVAVNTDFINAARNGSNPDIGAIEFTYSVSTTATLTDVSTATGPLTVITACNGNQVTANAATTALTPVTYGWTTPDAFAAGNNASFTRNVTTAMGGTYSVTATDPIGCTSTAAATLNVTPSATATAGTAISTCSGSGAVNITAGASATNASGVTWTSSGTGTFANANSLTACTYSPSNTDIAAGSVTLTLTATGNTPCGNASSNKTLTISTSPNAPLSGGDQTVCSGGSIPNLTVTAGGGQTANWYNVATGGVALASGTTSFATGQTNPGVYTYYAEAQNTTSLCVSTSRTPVTLTINAGPAAPTVQDNGITFSAIVAGSMTISWSNGDGNGHLVKMNQFNSFTNPVNNTSYPANPAWQNTGEQVVYNGAGSSVTVTGLNPNVVYWVEIYGYNGSACGINYNTSTAADNPIPDAFIWTGTISTVWGTTTNWSANAVPPNSCSANVYIPASTPFSPTLATAQQVGAVSVASGAVLTLNANLSLCQGWTGGLTTAGSVMGTGVVILNGSGVSQKILGNTSFNELRLDNPAGGLMQTGSKLSIGTSLDLQAGNFNSTNGAITFTSTSVTQIAILDNFSAGYTGTFTGNITAQRYYGFTYNSQHMLGSPINNPTMAQMGASGTSGYIIPLPNCDEQVSAANSPWGTVFSYHESNGSTCGQAQWFVETAGNANNAQGYSVVLAPANRIFALTGAPNLSASYSQTTGNSNWNNTTLQNRHESSGWMLMSNPYLATLNLTTANAGFDNQVQVWEANGPFAGTYQAFSVNSNAVIAPFQAFMVHKTSVGGSATYNINATDRTRSVPSTFYNMNSSELNISVQNIVNGLLDQTTVAFNSSATDQFDPAFDANKFGGSLNRHTLYTTLATGQWMAKNVLNSINTTSTVDMGLEPGATGSYTMTFTGINSFDASSYIYLEDKQTGTMVDVRNANGTYNFNADSADNWNRFVLHFTPPVTINTANASCTNAGNINITQPGSANWNYTITDANNQVIASGILNQTSPVNVNAQTGTYTLTLVDNNNYTVTKTITVNGTQDVVAGFTASATTVNTQTEVGFTSTSQNAITYAWNFGDGTSSTSSNPNHVFAQAGTYVVTLTVTSQTGCVAVVSQTITVSGATAINNTDAGKGISLWSSDNKVYVDFRGVSSVDATIKIYNILGQELSTDKYNIQSVYQKEINDIDAAYVMVSINNAGQIVTKKLFIANAK